MLEKIAYFFEVQHPGWGFFIIAVTTFVALYINFRQQRKWQMRKENEGECSEIFKPPKPDNEDEAAKEILREKIHDKLHYGEG